ncbi:MAG: hypothetical protein Phog2KO_40890 [Phototrophicaceae bacterium]
MGSGFAGQGHTEALRYCGVEVVGMVSRTKDVVEDVCAKLNIPYASTDWTQALSDLQPDIVAIATPGGAHFEAIMQALSQGCHVFSDKPLAETAEKSQQLYEQSKVAGVKTAYAASYRYQPNVLHAKELIQQGKVGQPLEIECISHFRLNPLIPFGWSHRIESGGGRLNNNFTHKLSIVEYLLDEGKITHLDGSIRNDMPKAPVVSGVHDFRTRRDFIPSEDELDTVEWADANAEWSYVATMQFESKLSEKSVLALFKHSGLQPRVSDDHIVIYGDEGAILMTGCYGQADLFIYEADTWVKQTLPDTILAQVPDIEADTERNWTALMREFVADIRGESYVPYQTFEQGWQYQRIIEHIRADNQTVWSA